MSWGMNPATLPGFLEYPTPGKSPAASSRQAVVAQLVEARAVLFEEIFSFMCKYKSPAVEHMTIGDLRSCAAEMADAIPISQAIAVLDDDNSVQLECYVGWMLSMKLHILAQTTALSHMHAIGSSTLPVPRPMPQPQTASAMAMDLNPQSEHEFDLLIPKKPSTIDRQKDAGDFKRKDDNDIVEAAASVLSTSTTPEGSDSCGAETLASRNEAAEAEAMAAAITGIGTVPLGDNGNDDDDDYCQPETDEKMEDKSKGDEKEAEEIEENGDDDNGSLVYAQSLPESLLPPIGMAITCESDTSVHSDLKQKAAVRKIADGSEASFFTSESKSRSVDDFKETKGKTTGGGSGEVVSDDDVMSYESDQFSYGTPETKKSLAKRTTADSPEVDGCDANSKYSGRKLTKTLVSLIAANGELGTSLPDLKLYLVKQKRSVKADDLHAFFGEKSFARNGLVFIVSKDNSADGRIFSCALLRKCALKLLFARFELLCNKKLARGKEDEDSDESGEFSLKLSSLRRGCLMASDCLSVFIKRKRIWHSAFMGAAIDDTTYGEWVTYQWNFSDKPHATGFKLAFELRHSYGDGIFTFSQK